MKSAHQHAFLEIRKKNSQMKLMSSLTKRVKQNQMEWDNFGKIK